MEGIIRKKGMVWACNDVEKFVLELYCGSSGSIPGFQLEIIKGAWSCCFELFWVCTKLSLNRRKPKIVVY